MRQKHLPRLPQTHCCWIQMPNQRSLQAKLTPRIHRSQPVHRIRLSALQTLGLMQRRTLSRRL